MIKLLEDGSDPIIGRHRGGSKINNDAMSANVRQLRPGQEGSSSLKDPPTPLVDKLNAVALALMGREVLREIPLAGPQLERGLRQHCSRTG